MALAGLNMIRGAGTLEFANVVSKDIYTRAVEEVQHILKADTPREVDQNKKAELDKIMTAQAGV
jgi:hypothetical protein